MEEGGKEVEKVAAIAVACLNLRGEDRPTMRQVELTLEEVRTTKEHILDKMSTKKVEEHYVAINCPSTKFRINHEGSTRQYSMEEEFIASGSYPR
jgi:hypothetical protein